MKKIFTLCALTAVIAAALIWRAAARPARFGAFSGAPRAEVASLIANPQANLNRTVEIEGVITEQCKAMGCYFFFQSGKGALRVDLQEVAMTAPMREGRRARVQGQIVPYNTGYEFFASAVEFE
ncbi:MAG TPA: hypothetical protein VMH28_22900 [Candidatus Acidoferrales bacterium]|nr:hypothetical protein [Candidatus Acidoferrales bacterium]